MTDLQLVRDDDLVPVLRASQQLARTTQLGDLIMTARRLQPGAPGSCLDYGRGMAELICRAAGLSIQDHLLFVARSIGMTESQIGRLS